MAQIDDLTKIVVTRDLNIAYVIKEAREIMKKQRNSSDKKIAIFETFIPKRDTMTSNITHEEL
jgi:hypothetical protein